MFATGGLDIYSRGIQAAVAEDVCKLGQILCHRVEGPRKQVAQVVRKNLPRVDLCSLTKRLHLPPDVAAAKRLSGFCHKYAAFLHAPGPQISGQGVLQLFRQKDRPGLALEHDHSRPGAHRLYRDIGQLAHADAGSADRLQDQTQPCVLLPLCRPDEPLVLRPAQLTLLPAEKLSLDAKAVRPAVLPAAIAEKAVETG